jgi:capsular exopolysaccharide synthesis family protein
LVSVPAAAAAAWFLLRPPTVVQNLLQINARQPVILFKTADSDETRDAAVSYQKVQAVLVTSRPVLTKALKDRDVAELALLREQANPIEWMEREIKVEANKEDSQLLRVTMKGDRIDEMVKLVNAVTRAYLEEIVFKEQSKRTFRLRQLSTVYDKYEKSLREKRRILRTLAESAGSGDDKQLQLSHSFALEQLHLVRKELLEVLAERRRLEMKVKLPPTLAELFPGGVPGMRADAFQDLVIAKHLHSIAQHQEKMALTKERSPQGEKDPSYLDHQRAIKGLQEAVAKRRKELFGEGSADRNSMALVALRDHIFRDGQRLELLGVMEKKIRDDVRKFTDEAKGINQSSLELVSLKEDIAQLEGVYSRIANEKEALKVELDAPERVVLIEEAYPAATLSAEKKRYLGLAGGALAALGLSLFGVGYLELRSRRITTSTDVVQGLGMRLLGTIPPLGKLARRGQTEAEADEPARQFLVESVDATRTVLLHAATSSAHRLLMITSAVGGEGKTTLASQLATSLANAGRKTLLLDGDLRRPAIHRLSNQPLEPGLADLLRGTATAAEAVRPTAVDGLSVIPAGANDAVAARALAQGGLKPILDGLREQFDIIVLDSCPVLPTADALVLAQHADAVVFSLLTEVSTLPLVHSAWKRLESLGVPMLGGIMNGLNEMSYGYTYYGAR